MPRTRTTKKSAYPAVPKSRPFCRNLPRTLRPLPPTVAADPRRARAILNTSSKWLNGTVLHYCFFGGGSHYAVPKVQADAIRGAFTKWKAVGIGLDFKEVEIAAQAVKDQAQE